MLYFQKSIDKSKSVQWRDVEAYGAIALQPIRAPDPVVSRRLEIENPFTLDQASVASGALFFLASSCFTTLRPKFIQGLLGFHYLRNK